MKREIITTDNYGKITIPSDTDNIWMNEMELVELLGVIAPTLRAAIRAVYKCGIFNPLEAEKRIKLPNGYYADIKRRKNESRTYFFDRAAERLNRRMMRDEKAERKRR